MTQNEETTPDERRRAVRELSLLELPVGEPDEMKRESVPDPEELAPETDRSHAERRDALA